MSDQKQLLHTARAINNFPVKRETFISTLSLEENSSRRSSSIIGHGLFYRETWEHESGLSITATDAEHANLRYDQESKEMITPIIVKCQQNEATRSSFDFFVVSKGRRVLYQSWDGEQSASCNPLPAAEFR